MGFVRQAKLFQCDTNLDAIGRLRGVQIDVGCFTGHDLQWVTEVVSSTRTDLRRIAGVKCTIDLPCAPRLLCRIVTSVRYS